MRVDKIPLMNYHFVPAQLRMSVNTKSLLKYRKKGTLPPTACDIVKLRNIIRQAASRYIGSLVALNSSPQQLLTPKEQNRLLKKVSTASRRILEQPHSSDWKQKLIALIDFAEHSPKFIGLHTFHLLRIRLKMTGGDIDQLINWLYGMPVQCDVNCMLSVLSLNENGFEQLISEKYADSKDTIDVALRNTQNRKAGVPDEILFDLVKALAPIWYTTTGYSVSLSSEDNTGSRKTSRFAEWLRELIAKANLQPDEREKENHMGEGDIQKLPCTFVKKITDAEKAKKSQKYVEIELPPVRRITGMARKVMHTDIKLPK